MEQGASLAGVTARDRRAATRSLFHPLARAGATRIPCMFRVAVQPMEGNEVPAPCPLQERNPQTIFPPGAQPLASPPKEVL